MKAKKISKDLLAKINNIPLDLLIEKHEMYSWNVLTHRPYLFEIEDKKIVLEIHLEPKEIELTRSFTSPDEQFMVVMYYNNEHEQNYIAIARWHPVAQIYVSLFCHASDIVDWENFKNIYIIMREEKEKNTEGSLLKK